MSESEDRLTPGTNHSDDGDMCEAEIDYNVMGSFPASDPPSWTLGISPRKKARSHFAEVPAATEPSHQNEPVSVKAARVQPGLADSFSSMRHSATKERE